MSAKSGKVQLRFADRKKLKKGKIRLSPYHSAKKRGTGIPGSHREVLTVPPGMGAFQAGLRLGHPTCSGAWEEQAQHRVGSPAQGEQAAPRSARPRGRRAAEGRGARRRGREGAAGQQRSSPDPSSGHGGEGSGAPTRQKAQLTPRSSSERKSGPSSRPSC